MRIIILLGFLLWIGRGSAQTTIKGVVNSKEDGKGISGVSISIKDRKTATMLTYAITDYKGAYHLNFSSSADSLVISAAGFNMEKQTLTIPNRNQNLNFNIKPQAIVLKEIKINPPKIRKLSDTINYLVDGFKDKNDRTIGDVLRKMPGIEVKDDGSILYNNKPINKFYIEDKDLLQGRYGIATNNIEVKDVATVQVLENHQPVKALKNREFSDEPALNIKLKDAAKGVLVANAKLAAGIKPLLWNNELFSMYFNKGRQNMNTYKGNNTGNDPGADLTSYYSDGNNNNNSTSLAVQSPAFPAISQNRYLFNRAHVFTSNHMWVAGKDNQLNANISYLDDRRQNSSFSRSMYYLAGDSLLAIEETLAAAETTRQLDASFQLNKNKENYYLDNVFKIKGKWNDVAATVMKQDTISQQLKTPLFAVNNTLSLIKNYKRSSLKVYSYHSYSRTPENLTVNPALYGDLFSGITDAAAIRQGLVQDQFIANNRVSFGLTEGVWKQNYDFGFNANLQHFQSDLQQVTTTGNVGAAPDTLRNRLNWNKYEVYAHPNYIYAKNAVRVTLHVPLSYNYLGTNDEVTGQDKTISRLFFNPSLTINYDFNLFLALAANARYGNQLGDIGNVFTGYVMQSYRILVRNDGQLPEKKTESYRLDLNYRHPLHAIFVNLGASYARNKMNLLYGYDYQGILSLKKTYNIPNSADTYSIYTRISKGLDFLATVLTLDATYNENSSTSISQAQLVTLKNLTYLIKPGLSAKIGTWTSLNYSFQFATSKNILNGASTFSPIRSNTQRTQVNFFPIDGITINLAHEYFYSSAVTSGNRTMNFADAGVKYRYKNMEFSVNYDNVFNIKQYISAYYSNTNTYYSAYDLRPAQLLAGIRFKLK